MRSISGFFGAGGWASELAGWPSGGAAVGLRRRRPPRPRRSRPGARAGRAPAPWSPRPPRGSQRSPRTSDSRAPCPRRPGRAAPRPRGTAPRAAPPAELRSVVLLPQPSLLQDACRSAHPRPVASICSYSVVGVRGIDREGLSHGWASRAAAIVAAAHRSADSCDTGYVTTVSVSSSGHDATSPPHHTTTSRRAGPTTHVSLTRVGVTNVDKVIRIQSNGGEQLFYAELECFVDLGPTRRARTCRASRRSSTRRSTR